MHQLLIGIGYFIICIFSWVLPKYYKHNAKYFVITCLQLAFHKIMFIIIKLMLLLKSIGINIMPFNIVVNMAKLKFSLEYLLFCDKQ